MDLLIAFAVFLLCAGVGAMLAERAYERAAAADRMSEVAHAADDRDLLARQGPSRAAPELFEHRSRFDLMRRLEQAMWQAGMYQGANSALLTMGMLLAGGFAAASAISHDGMIALGSGLVLGGAPLLYIRIRRNRRLKTFLLQLPLALDLLKSTLEAGHTLQRGMQVVEREFADPLGGEFRTVVEQTRLGMQMTQALSDMLRRVPLDDLRLFVVAVKVQTDVGSSLAQIIGRLSEIVRTRQNLASQIRALTAQSRMSGMVVGLLPVVVLAMFSLIQPTYVEMLFFDHTGKMILRTALALDLGAFFLIRRILRVRF